MKLTWIALIGLISLTAACGDDAGVGTSGAVVGGPCVSSSTCAVGSLCAQGGDFPAGTCTVACRSDLDCPQGTACIDKESGLCLLACSYAQDCRAGYTCKARDRVGIKGQALVCIND